MADSLRISCGGCRQRQRQQGFGLVETAIAALFFAISVLGLLQYHQRLQQVFVHQWQQRQAWHLAYQQLAIYAAMLLCCYAAGRGRGDTDVT
ncbi:type IV pilus modification PilV family protein [Symbiopectobacterium sp.]|uniref:type IV pilus modification PilV family protein n=1 Tax=Symbiopectobacterium sp. TaxID=2952789 RepID=UPI003F3D9F5E